MFVSDSSFRRRRLGSSLVETIVVIGILGLLMTLTASAVMRVRTVALRTGCSNNLRQLGLALTHYSSTHGRYPTGVSYRGGADPSPLLGWGARLLPYLEQEPLWQQSVAGYRQTPDFSLAPHPSGAILPVFGCPSDARVSMPARPQHFPVGLSSYLGVQGRNEHKRDGVLFVDSQVTPSQITDGLSNTLLVGERPPSADLRLGWWYGGYGQNGTGALDVVMGAREYNLYSNAPDCSLGPHHYGPGRFDDICSAFHFWSPHAGGAHFLFCDGSVHFLAYSADALLPALASRAGGEVVGSFD
jgi:prepilin-type processing-associated H-X9-DG protein